MSASPRPRLEPSLQSARHSARLTRSQINRNLRVLISKGLIEQFSDGKGVMRYRTFAAKAKP